jgi:hypothetical protein
MEGTPMVKRLVLVAIVAVTLWPSAVPAQSAAVDTQMQLESRRKRLVVRPEPPVAEGIRDAERAAAGDSAEHFSRDANPIVPRTPQLDYDVTNAIQARNLPRVAPSRTR